MKNPRQRLLHSSHALTRQQQHGLQQLFQRRVHVDKAPLWYQPASQAVVRVPALENVRQKHFTVLFNGPTRLRMDKQIVQTLSTKAQRSYITTNKIVCKLLLLWQIDGRISLSRTGCRPMVTDFLWSLQAGHSSPQSRPRAMRSSEY